MADTADWLEAGETAIAPDDPRLRYDGAVELEARPEGHRVHRLPLHRQHQMPADIQFIESVPAGVRIVFDTDATALAVGCTPLRIADGDSPPRPVIFTCVANGNEHASREAVFGHVVRTRPETPQGFDFERGGPGRCVFDGLPAGRKTVELWLPHAAGLTLHGLGVADDALVAAAPADRRPRWLHHGSSISHCMEAETPTGTWPAVAASLTGHHLVGLGLAGQAQLDPFTARAIRDAAADRISLKLGINVVNADSLTMRTFGPAVHGFLDTVREGHPNTPLLVISPIFCAPVEDMPGPTDTRTTGTCRALGTPEDKAAGALTLRRVRRVLEEIVADRIDAGDRALAYLDGLALFGPDDAVDLPDGLHPNAAGYRRMGDRFAEHGFLA